MKSHFVFFTIFITISFSRFSNAQMIQLESFQIDEKEVSIGDFSQYINLPVLKLKQKERVGVWCMNLAGKENLDGIG